MKVMKYKNSIIVYIYNKKIKDIKDTIKTILESLRKYYNYEINNSYNLKLYTNKYYGMIVEIIENDDDSIDKNIVNINLKILKDTLFLYEVNDPLDYLKNEIYYYDNKYYINIKEKNMSILENSNLIYGKEAYKIIGSGIRL